MSTEEPKRKFNFNPSLSFDGVAIIIGVASVLIWVGALKQQVSQLQNSSDAHSLKLETMESSVDRVQGGLDVLSAVVQERTGKPVYSPEEHGNGGK
jgi:hypothetical protein